MANIICRICANEQMMTYVEARRYGTEVEYQTVGLCSLCGHTEALT